MNDDNLGVFLFMQTEALIHPKVRLVSLISQRCDPSDMRDKVNQEIPN